VQPFGDDQLTRLFTMLLQSEGAKVEYDELRECEPVSPPVDDQQAANARIRAALGG
jgi:hypothetical protein